MNLKQQRHDPLPCPYCGLVTNKSYRLRCTCESYEPAPDNQHYWVGLTNWAAPGRQRHTVKMPGAD